MNFKAKDPPGDLSTIVGPVSLASENMTVKAEATQKRNRAQHKQPHPLRPFCTCVGVARAVESQNNGVVSLTESES